MAERTAATGPMGLWTRGVKKKRRHPRQAFARCRDAVLSEQLDDFLAGLIIKRDGVLRLSATYPEVAWLEDHLVEIKHEIDTFKPHRIAIDSLSALERIGTAKGFREFIIGLTSFVKAEQIAGLFTATTSSLFGGSSITEGHISTLTDSIAMPCSRRATSTSTAWSLRCSGTVSRRDSGERAGGSPPISRCAISEAVGS